MSFVTVQFDAKSLVDVLDQYDAAARNLREVMGLISTDMLTAVEDNFASEGATSPAGKWKELSKTTEARRRKKGGGAKILQDSGAMAGSVHESYGDDFAEVYTNDPKAPFHVSDEPRSIIPLRDFLSIDLDAIQEDAAEELLAQIAGA